MFSDGDGMSVEGAMAYLTVGDLRRLTANLPDDAPVLEKRYSDYGPMEAENVEVIDAVIQAGGEWYQPLVDRGLPAGARRVKALYVNGN